MKIVFECNLEDLFAIGSPWGLTFINTNYFTNFSGDKK